MTDATPTSTVTATDSAPSVSVSAPETTATAVSTPSERPTSMAQAFERVAAKRTTDPRPADATVPPVAATPDGTTTDKPATPKPGPIPFEVHSKALENARTKEREAALTEWKQQYGWAEQVDRSVVEQAVRIGQLFKTDRAAFVRELIGDNPDPALISEFARTLSSRRGSSAPAIDLEPDLQVTDANGNPTGHGTYSAQKVQAIVQHAVTEALQREVAPLKQAEQQRQIERETTQKQAERKEFATSTTADLRQLPHFKERESAIKARFAAMPLRNPDDPNEVALALHKAYTQELTEGVLPNLSRTEQAQAVASLKQKAVAQVETPSGTAPTPSARPKNAQELAKFLEQRSQARARAR